MKQIYCIGSGTADVVVHPFDRLPKPGTGMTVDPIILRSGGCGVNPAVTLRRLGAHPYLTCKLAHDEFGDFIVRSLQKEDVDISQLSYLKPGEGGTMAFLVCVSSDGERSFAAPFGASAPLLAEDLDEEAIEKADLFFFSTAATVLDYRDGEPQLLKRLKAAGKIIATDSIGYEPEGASLQDFVRSVAYYTDYFMPSRDEAQAWSGLTDPLEMARLFRSWGAKNVVIKLNREGAFYLTEQGEYGISPAYLVEAIDTTGAGDSFCGGFLMGWSQGRPFDECLKIANATAAHCVMQRGATDGIPNLSQLEAFIAQREKSAERK